MAVSFEIGELIALRELARSYGNVEAAHTEATILRASLSLPKGTVHVISDVHGEYKKLRHVINNASGSLRTLVAEKFADRLSEAEQKELLSVLYYPHETLEHLRSGFVDDAARREWVGKTLRRQFEIIRELAHDRRRSDVERLFPSDVREIFAELFSEPAGYRSPQYVETIIDSICSYEREAEMIRTASRLVRNLSVSELVVAGDLGDRGDRLDKVVDYLIHQPNVVYTWGNHDTSWMGACLGHEPSIATVLRISLRYLRLYQLEEGYGITLVPLEKLVRDVYPDDPAERFQAKRVGARDEKLVARMQKAAAIIQFKLEGQMIRRRPEWKMENRALLHRINRADKTIEIDGKIHELLDSFLPTVDPENPYELSAEERECLNRMKESFVSSQRLWEHMSYVVRHGAMWLQRDHCLVFHGCIPVDEEGALLALEVDGKPRTGRDLFDALDSVVRRAFRLGYQRVGNEADWLWYLWTGALSPLFGKDRMTTFENYFVADKAAHKETKNPYFNLIHDADFCNRMFAEFGLDENGLIVNGHVPVKIEKGEEPVKRSGKAVTIDGAFSAAYGDHGYTLILAPERIAIAEHHHFASITEAIHNHADIVPKIATIRDYKTPRLISETEEGEQIRQRIKVLERLILAYEEGAIVETL